MTVSYAGKVSSTSWVGAFFRLLLIWKGSLYKLVWVDYLVWLNFYFILSIVYRCALNHTQRTHFENFCNFCETYMEMIPLAFVLGFFVSIMVTRWWNQFMALPWPDNSAITLNYVCPGTDDQSRLIRRTVVRYVNLCIVLMLRTVSSKVTKRFPTYQHMVEAGLMTKNECSALVSAEAKSNHGVYWVPISWATVVTEQAWHCGYIKHSRLLITVNQELIKVKDAAGTILCYDWVNLPIIYTQVVTVAAYFYLVTSLFARQFLHPANSTNPAQDYYFPIFSSVQLIFYLGWLKVGESLLNPFGEDDDDFDVNILIDRGLQLAILMVDDVGRFPPHMEKDKFWKVSVPSELPFTAASLPFRSEFPAGSGQVQVPLEGQKVVNVDDTDKTVVIVDNNEQDKVVKSQVPLEGQSDNTVVIVDNNEQDKVVKSQVPLEGQKVVNVDDSDNTVVIVDNKEQNKDVKDDKSRVPLESQKVVNVDDNDKTVVIVDSKEQNNDVKDEKSHDILLYKLNN